MTDENLGDVLDESYRAHQRTVAIKNLGDRTHLTLGQISKLCDHPQHGAIVATITLEELLEMKDPGEETTEEATEPPAKPSPSPSRKTAKKAAAKKAPPAKKAAAKKAPAAKKAAAKKSSKGEKADKGKPKPRLDYDLGMKEVLGALKAAKEPMGRTAIENATGFTGVQVRAFAKKLAGAGKIKILGEGGRSTKYEAA